MVIGEGVRSAVGFEKNPGRPADHATDRTVKASVSEGTGREGHADSRSIGVRLELLS